MNDLASNCKDLERLNSDLPYSFEDEAFLRRSMTHRSYANEADGELQDNQRLEFLGDAVLDLITADELFSRHGSVDEGWLTRRQSQIVRQEKLVLLAEKLDLGEYLRLGWGEISSGGRNKDSLLADAFEALVAAVYLDGGFDDVRRFLVELLDEELNKIRSSGPAADYKSKLQTFVQRRRGIQPNYQIIERSGPPHDRTFVAEVEIDDEPKGSGRGATKQEAEQNAAAEALQKLETEHSLEGH